VLIQYLFYYHEGHEGLEDGIVFNFMRDIEVALSLPFIIFIFFMVKINDIS
jgi:hypothetical protein